MLKIIAVCEESQGCPLYSKGARLDFTVAPPTVTGLDGVPVCSLAVDPLQKAAVQISGGQDAAALTRTFCGGCPAGKAWWGFQPVVKETEAHLSPAAAQFILDSVSKMKFFGGVHPAKLLRIVKLIKVSRVPPGSVIVERGRPGEGFFIILEGVCEVVQHDENGRESVLVTLPSGECFGEMSLITGEPATATVRARGDSTVLAISKENFHTMLGIAPELAITLARILAARLTNTSLKVLEELRKGMKGRLDLISPAELI